MERTEVIILLKTCNFLEKNKNNRYSVTEYKSMD